MTITIQTAPPEPVESSDKSEILLRLMSAMMNRLQKPDPISFDSKDRLRVVSDTRPIGGG